MNNALNQVLDGPHFIEDWEFHMRIGVRTGRSACATDAFERLQRGHEARTTTAQVRSRGRCVLRHSYCLA
jgi:hypothetical protein